MRILLAGGGTGGHIYPALAIAEKLKTLHPDCEILYVGTKRGLENKIVPQRGIPFRTIAVEGLPRKISPALIKALGKAAGGCMEARKIVKEFHPDLVIGTGGYVCGPVVLSARMMGIPAMIHEQNAFPGVTNKILARFVNQILVNFKASEQYFVHKERICVTGLPVRQEVLSTTKEAGLEYFNLSKDKVTLLVSGGSRGARSLNQAMADAYPTLVEHPELQIIHATGAAEYENTLKMLENNHVDISKSPQIIIKPYIDEMQYALAAADFCVGRAGATFLAEMTACGLPGILIPYPYAAENHQEYNAKALVDQNAAVMILDKDLNGETLKEHIVELYNNNDKRNKMAESSKQAGKRDSLDEIIRLIEKNCR